MLAANSSLQADTIGPVATPHPPNHSHLSEPIVAAHYFGSHWPKNFISAFRRGDVPGDFARLREDGFNSVIFVVSWGDFQPVIDPCCSYDERAFERLQFLLEQARSAGLAAILRVGYVWSFHPEGGDPIERAHLLMNRSSVQEAYLRFVHRLAMQIAADSNVILSFMSWEDQWLHRIEEEARRSFEDYASLLPAGLRPMPGGTFPAPNSESAPLFHAYWDWLVMYGLFEPARRLLPKLTYEARIDKEPHYAENAAGKREIVAWINHHGMYRQSGAEPITVYWAPFWGADNVGEQLSAARAGDLFAAMLKETRELSGGRPIFIDQFNVIDNTLGYEKNAVIAPEEVAAFFAAAPCIMSDHGVVGFGYWTSRDYQESPLYNPSFAFGLEGWDFAPARDQPARAALRPLPTGDNDLEFRAGDSLSQRITKARGRLPAKDDRDDWVCVEAIAELDSELSVALSSESPASLLRFAQGTVGRQCALVAAPEDPQELLLQIRAQEGSGLWLRAVWLYDHVQEGSLYDETGNPGSIRASLVQLNLDLRRRDLAELCRNRRGAQK